VSSTKQEAVVRAEPAVPGGTVAENQGKPVAAEAGRRGDQQPTFTPPAPAPGDHPYSRADLIEGHNLGRLRLLPC
jgi:hypothetical protein